MLKNLRLFQTAKENRARQLSTEAYETAYKEWYNDPKSKQSQKPKQINYKMDPETIDEQSLVFRLMTFEHVPLNRKKKQTQNSSRSSQQVQLSSF